MGFEVSRGVLPVVLGALLVAGAGRAEVPYPACALPACDPACAAGDAACTGPDDYPDYLFLAPGEGPDDLRFDPADPTRGDDWLYVGLVESGPAAGVTAGMNVVGAWTLSTGRPDVVGAVLDSGIQWGRRDLARKAALNTGELPLPAGCPASRDCDGNGVVNVDDFAGAACAGGVVSDGHELANGNGFLDGQDLIRLCSDGVDDDGNGYVDDIAGWDFQHDDNDPEDDTDYGHGTGEAGDQVHEANNGGSQAGVAPASMFLPLKVADSFVGIDTDFAQAMVYAVDWGVDYISEALGTVNQSAFGQEAVDYAYRRGVPLIASAADEQSRHHNLPAAYEHTIWVNSITTADGFFLAEKSPPEFTLQNGCTNHGGRAWVAISSNACSSEATSRAGGITSLLIAHGKNQIERGLLSPHPETGTPYSAEEVRQIFRLAAEDVDHSADPTLPFTSAAQLLVNIALSIGPFQFAASHFPTQAGWDQFTGYGRPDALAMLSVAEDRIPPEVDLSGSLRWFDTLDPARTPSVPVRASAAARRAPGGFDWSLEVGCGVQPTAYLPLASGRSATPLERALLHDWQPGDTAADCGFDPQVPIEDPDAHTVTLRLQVTDSRGNLGEDRRTVAIHGDSTLAFAPVALGASGESSPTLADVSGDGVLEMVFGTTAGEVQVRDGRTGALLPGFPALTDPLPVHPSPAYTSGEVRIPRESVLAATAVDDLDGDGAPEIVAAALEGGLYVFDAAGGRRPGFPVRTDPARSSRAVIDRYNDADPGIVAAPTLVDLDAPGGDGSLEIVVAGMDGHVYAWRHDGSPVSGFPVKIADPAQVAVDPATGKLTPIVPPPAGDVRSRLAKIIGSPAVGDVDGDGRAEILVATNEEYRGAAGFDAPSNAFGVLANNVSGELDLDVAGRIHALNHDGTPVTSAHGEPASWPAQVPMLIAGLLPTVGTGVPGSPALADVDGPGEGGLAVAIFASVGPAVLLDGTGASLLPEFRGKLQPLAIDFPGGGFPLVPPTAGSADGPFLPGLGSGAFGDLDADGLPEYVAPTAGLRVLLDALVPGQQEFSDHQITAWNPRDGSVLPAFPRVMDDLQFLSSPTVADVSGDGRPEVVNGSGAYLVRAYDADGATPEGFPKFTHGWVLASPAVGDVDGDGRSELVAVTREGNLYVWNTFGIASEAAIPWQGFARDRRNSGNLESGVSVTGAVRGDCDGDRDTDEDDRDLLLGALGLGESDAGFLPAADLDGDGRITFVDYQLWIAAFRAFLAAQLPLEPASGCGLLGVEPLLLLALRRRRARRLS